MKTKKSKPLTQDELETFKSLFRRWVLHKYPGREGSSDVQISVELAKSVPYLAYEIVREDDKDEQSI
jgi:hypothetical protein